MNRTILLNLNSIQKIIPVFKNIQKTEQIQELKQAIYLYRNQLLSTMLETTIQNQSFTQTEFGKPYLIDYPKFSLNHSHSQKYYVLATSFSVQDLGVDIEDLDRQVRFDALARHAFHPEEYQTWQDLEADPEYWFKVWTAKEAVLKASGLGIRLSLNELNTHAHPVENGGVCSHPLIGVFAYQNYHIGNCMLTIAWRSEHSCRGFAFPLVEIIQH